MRLPRPDRTLWAYWAGLLLVNAGLSYGPSYFLVRTALLVLLGLLVWVIVRRVGPDRSAQASSKEKAKGQVDLWLLLTLVLLGLFLRFYELTTARPWPYADEALQGFFANGLLEKWDWRFFYTTGQHPPALIWCLAFGLKLSHSSLLTLWFVPALFSSLYLLTAYGASVLLLPRSTRLVFLTLNAISFWPLLFGRFSVQGALLPFFEAVAFLLYGLLSRSSTLKATKSWSLLLGLWLGLGTWVYTSWFAVIFFFVVILLWSGKSEKPTTQALIPLFLSGLLIGSGPWLWSAFHENFGGYLLGISVAGRYYHWQGQLMNSLSYLTTLFWGSWSGPSGYGPKWGGLLNPVLTSFFWIGLIGLSKERAQPRSRSILGALVLFLLPGMLSADFVEVFRIVQVLPILLLVVALGVRQMAEKAPWAWRPPFFILIAIGSASLDLTHLSRSLNLMGPQSIQAPSTPSENERAFHYLEGVSRGQGPGLVFCDLLLLSRDHSLNVATYDFNALLNDRARAVPPRWAGLVVNVHYVPFLKNRFPGSRWMPLSSQLAEDGGMAVGVIPLTPDQGPIFRKWAAAHQFFHERALSAENVMNDPVAYRAEEHKLQDGLALVEGDPFLESFFGEWAAQYHSEGNYQENIRALQRALAKGYPTANLYYKLGNFLWLDHRIPEARRAYSLAARCRPNYTNVQAALDYLQKLPEGEGKKALDTP